MNKVKYSFLIFVLILAPVIQAVGAVNYNSVEPIVINKPNCHETKLSTTVYIDISCECKDCQCECFSSHITTVGLFFFNSNFNIYHDSLVISFSMMIPNKVSLPLFRPPIS